MAYGALDGESSDEDDDAEEEEEAVIAHDGDGDGGLAVVKVMLRHPTRRLLLNTTN